MIIDGGMDWIYCLVQLCFSAIFCPLSAPSLRAHESLFPVGFPNFVKPKIPPCCMGPKYPQQSTAVAWMPKAEPSEKPVAFSFRQRPPQQYICPRFGWLLPAGPWAPQHILAHRAGAGDRAGGCATPRFPFLNSHAEGTVR